MLAASRLIIVLFGLLWAGNSWAQTAPAIATDYEWQLTQPGRTLFRDRLPVGNIELTGGRKEKATGEVLQVLTDIAFEPGDTVRFFAVNVRLVSSGQLVAESILDGSELPGLMGAVRYALETAKNIAGTERAETLVSFRTRAGFAAELLHFGTQQQFNLEWPTLAGRELTSRAISADQMLQFADLLDLTIFELNRQGAGLKLKLAKP